MRFPKIEGFKPTTVLFTRRVKKGDTTYLVDLIYSPADEGWAFETTKAKKVDGEWDDDGPAVAQGSGFDMPDEAREEALTALKRMTTKVKL